MSKSIRKEKLAGFRIEPHLWEEIVRRAAQEFITPSAFIRRAVLVVLSTYDVSDETRQKEEVESDKSRQSA